MVSILTNVGAISALRILRTIGDNLTDTQMSASSGLRIREARDNAAYWSIATAMRSENGANEAVSDTNALSQAIVDVAYPAAEIVMNSLIEIRNLAIQAQNTESIFPANAVYSYPGVGGGRVIDNYNPNWQTQYAGTILSKLDDAAAQHLRAARSAMEAASFNGVNLLIKPDDGKSLKDNIASFVVGYDRGRVQTLDLKGADFALLNDGRDVSDVDEDAQLEGLTSYMTPDGSGGMVRTWFGNWTLFTARQGGQYNDVRPEGVLFDLELGMQNQPGFTRGEAYDIFINNLSKQIDKVVTVMAKLGSVQDSLGVYAEFNEDRIDAIRIGVGRLVDADMNEVSTRIKALEVQQKLGIQSLQIAKSDAENVLSLFR